MKRNRAATALITHPPRAEAGLPTQTATTAKNSSRTTHLQTQNPLPEKQQQQRPKAIKRERYVARGYKMAGNKRPQSKPRDRSLRFQWYLLTSVIHGLVTKLGRRPSSGRDLFEVKAYPPPSPFPTHFPHPLNCIRAPSPVFLSQAHAHTLRDDFDLPRVPANALMRLSMNERIPHSETRANERRKKKRTRKTEIRSG